VLVTLPILQGITGRTFMDLTKTLLPSSRPWTITAAVLAVMALAGFGAAKADAFACRNNAHFTLRSAENLRYVSAEMSYTEPYWALLRARAVTPGPWESFTMYCSGSTHAFRSDFNGRWVAAEVGRTGTAYGVLRARTTGSSPGPWERFQFYDSGAGTVAIYSQAADKVVSAELGWTGSYYGTLRARADYAGPWERFYLTYQ
jgi:hypothetical protein